MEPIWLLVTTSKSLLLIDPQSGRGYRIDEGRGLYYGIAIDEDQIWVGARCRLVSSSIPQDEERGQILLFDRHWRCDALPPAPFPLRDIHQILLHQGQLWVTCSFDNAVAIYDDTRGEWSLWHPLGIPQGEPKDLNHFNTLAIFDQRLCVVAHNKGDSDLLFFQLPDGALVDSIRLGNQAHNVWRRGPAWAMCSSGEGKLVGTDGWTVETGGFPRGIAFLGAEICVGISEIAERAQRDFTTSQLALFNDRWELQQRIQLIDEGLLLEICPLPADWNPPVGELITFPVL
jgi:hypothetical protein